MFSSVFGKILETLSGSSALVSSSVLISFQVSENRKNNEPYKVIRKEDGKAEGSKWINQSTSHP